METETRTSADHGAAVAMARAILLPVSATGRGPAGEVPRPVARAAAQPEPARATVPVEQARVVSTEPVRVRTASITPPVSRPVTDATETTGSLGAKRKVEEPAPKSDVRGWLVQIGAYDRESAAKAALAKAKERLSGPLGRLEPITETTGDGGGRLWRARFAGLKDQKAAEAACKELRRKDFACLALRQ
jgi:D-alanyl-D-alanine carboxypeptidase